jgi:hypothetical protein
MTMAATTRTTTAASSSSSSSSLASSLLRRTFEGGEEEEESDEPSRSIGLAHLEAFLVLNRSRVAEWVEHQKAVVDAHAERRRQAALAEQNQLDRLHQNLLALQLDRSLCLADDDEGAEAEEKGDDDDTAEGTTTHRRLVTEQKQVEADLDRVQAVARDRQAEIEGSSKNSSKSINAASWAVGVVGTENKRRRK